MFQSAPDGGGRVRDSGEGARASWRCDLRDWEEKVELVLGLFKMRKPGGCVRASSKLLRGLVVFYG